MEQTSSKKQNKWSNFGFVVAFVAIVCTFVCDEKSLVGQPSIELDVLHADSIRVVMQDLSQIERNLGISLGGIENVVPFAAAAPLLTVDAIIEGRQARLLLDSGSCGLDLFRNRLRVRMGRIDLDRGASISGMRGSARASWFRVVVSIGNDSLGSDDIAITDVDFSPAYDFDGLLGFAKMGFRRVSFDFQKGLFGWD